MKITIFNPAPIGETLTKWGDYPFGRALQRSLETLGARVTQRYWPDWQQDQHDEADVHLVLRGKRPFPGAHLRPAILWLMSHPSSVSKAELSGYDCVLLGSKRHHALLGDFVRTGEFDVARQCSEFTPEFTPSIAAAAGAPAAERRGVIFVANSRGIRRPILRWAVELGLPVEVYGRDWDTFGLRRLVRAEHVDSESLGPLYRQSRLALNDHWTDMQYFGYINNRIFDCVAAGLPLVTDEFAELHEVFGASVLYARDRTQLMEAYGRYLHDYDGLQAAIGERWRRIGPDYTFDSRARLIADIVERILARGRSAQPAQQVRPDPGAAELAGLLAGATGVVHVLHLMPSCHLAGVADLDDRVGYVTAGLGCGPWTVAVDEQLSAFSSRSFNVIIVDDVSGYELADAVDGRAFLEAVTRCLRQDGRLLVHAEASLVRAARPGWTSDCLLQVSASYLAHENVDTTSRTVPDTNSELTAPPAAGASGSATRAVQAVRFDRNPIITPESGAGTGDNINGPSLIRVPEWLPQPLGRYYLYFAHHRGKYIRLAYADRLEGPWAIHGPGTLQLEETACKGHIASPDVHVDDERREIRMYFHGPAVPRSRVAGGGRSLKQVSMVATSADGIRFTASPEPLGEAYFRVFQWQGQHYAIAREGKLFRSIDGMARFERGGNAFGPLAETLTVRHVAVHTVGDTLYVFYSRIGDAPERILLSAIDLRQDWRAWRASAPVTVLAPELACEGAGLPVAPSRSGPAPGPLRELRDPAIYTESGTVYLLYSVAGENGIAIARLSGLDGAIGGPDP